MYSVLILLIVFISNYIVCLTNGPILNNINLQDKAEKWAHGHVFHDENENGIMDIDEDGSNHTPTSDELLMYNGNSQQPSVSNSSNYHYSHHHFLLHN